MLYVLPLSMSLLFHLLTSSTVVALVFHLYNDVQWPYSHTRYEWPYVLQERFSSAIILSLVLVRHLGR